MNKEKLKLLKNKLLLLSLMSMLGVNITGCNKDKETIDTSSITITDDELKNDYVYANNEEANQEIAEIKKEKLADTKEEVDTLINSKVIQKIYYATSDTELTIPAFLNETGIDEIITLPMLECLEVYDQLDDTCLVKTDEYIGYVNTTNLEELTGTFVVVDISSQEVKLYKDNQVILSSPVVTGKPGKNESDKGLFEIYDISGPRYLIDPNGKYKSFVDIMMKYNGGEGLHDAEYHTHEDGFKHGWRSIEDFGGETYLTNGSHGCINMIRDDVMFVRDHVDIGTKVLVKE